MRFFQHEIAIEMLTIRNAIVFAHIHFSEQTLAASIRRVATFRNRHANYVDSIEWLRTATVCRCSKVQAESEHTYGG